jgi:hypothetical protein
VVRSDKNKRSCDIGYALAIGFCKEVDNVDACTVTASDVTVAFATSDPNVPLAEFVGFFGSERPANCFTGAITQPTSDWQRFIDANPFDHRHKPDFGYAPAARSCERTGCVDACTVSACHVITAFAVSGPDLPLAEPVGFFGSERPANCFTVQSLSLLRISRCLFQLSFQLSTRVILTDKRELSTPKSCANRRKISPCSSIVKPAKNAGTPTHANHDFQISTEASTTQRCKHKGVPMCAAPK